MNTQEHYQSDLLFYFDGRPQELALYEDLFQAMSAAFPDACVKVQKSQISFYGRHLFAAASLPVRRKKAPLPPCLGMENIWAWTSTMQSSLWLGALLTPCSSEKIFWRETTYVWP